MKIKLFRATSKKKKKLTDVSYNSAFTRNCHMANHIQLHHPADYDDETDDVL